MAKFLREEMGWPEVKAVLKETDPALLPIGCTEEHGLHLPLNVDTACARYISEKVAAPLYQEHRYRIAIAPAVIKAGEKEGCRQSFSV